MDEKITPERLQSIRDRTRILNQSRTIIVLTAMMNMAVRKKRFFRCMGWHTGPDYLKP